MVIFPSVWDFTVISVASIFLLSFLTSDFWSLFGDAGAVGIIMFPSFADFVNKNTVSIFSVLFFISDVSSLFDEVRELVLMSFSVFDVGISGSVAPNFFGPVVHMILADNFVCIFEVHTEVFLTAGVLGI